MHRGFSRQKPFLKRLKHVGIALGLFRKPENRTLLEDWEFDQFTHQLPTLFPAQGRFVESQNDLSKHFMPGWLFIDKDTLSKTQPDLKAVNRVGRCTSPTAQFGAGPSFDSLLHSD